jgi:redox-sensitive bicupin YhaK (pirin superfamily)
MKKIADILRADGNHWVGDGFPVRSLFSYHHDSGAVSPFLLFDYAGPHRFDPTDSRRGVGQHPHRGFETVTIVYDGEVAHRDSAGNGGVIGPGDVQWMTAARGIIHEEFHSPNYGKTGGPFRMVQLWVNLPAKDKMSPPSYQAITSGDIPVVPLAGGTARIIAGEFHGVRGPARTCTPVNLWDLRLDRATDLTLDFPEGHTAMIAVLSGKVLINGTQTADEAEIVRFERDGSDVTIHADREAIVLILTGEPIDDPVVGYGPFVMNSEAEIRQAADDFNNGRFGQVGSPEPLAR